MAAAPLSGGRPKRSLLNSYNGLGLCDSLSPRRVYDRGFCFRWTPPSKQEWTGVGATAPPVTVLSIVVTVARLSNTGFDVEKFPDYDLNQVPRESRRRPSRVQPHLAYQDLGAIIPGVSPAGSGIARFHGELGARVDRPPDGSKSRWRGSKSRRLILAYLTGLGLVMVSGLPPPAVGYVVILGACVFLGTVLGALGGESNGLRDHRQ